MVQPGIAALIQLLMVPIVLASEQLAVVWRIRALPAARALQMLLVAVILWTGGFAAELALPGVEAKSIAQRIEFMGILAVPVALLSLALHANGSRTRRQAWMERWLVVAPALLNGLAVLSNSSHQLFYEAVHVYEPTPGVTLLASTPGP